jgi:cell division protein FtsI (penicillin-binding protein 3)
MTSPPRAPGRGGPRLRVVDPPRADPGDGGYVDDAGVRYYDPGWDDPRYHDPYSAAGRGRGRERPGPGGWGGGDRRAGVRHVGPRRGSRRQAARRPAARRQAARRPARAAARRPPRLGNPRRRLRVAAVGCCALLLVIAGRLTQLQGLQAAAYAHKAELQRLQTTALPAVRGSITDRSGAVLAVDVDARAVYADPFAVADKKRTAALLGPLLNIPASTLVRKMAGTGRFVYLARGLDPAVGTRVQALVTKDDLLGIGVLPERRRLYPSGPLASNVVGFTHFGDSDMLVGGGGIELTYDSTLRGVDGTRTLEADADGRPIPNAGQKEKDAVPGSGVRLTLDRDIQWSAQTAIAQAVKQTSADTGTVVVMEPGTGNVLAMANAPGFDPNNVREASATDMGNLATSAPYEPGSVNKIITMAAAINEGLVTPATPVTVPPTLRVGPRTFHDAEAHGTEHLTVAGVLAKSSNIGTVEIAQRLGSPALAKALHAFGLGSPTGVNFPGESAGVLSPESTWNQAQATTIPFGQGMSATALQMASVYATIANGGVRVTPRLVAATVSPDGTTHPTMPSAGTRVVTAATASTVSRMLEQVTSSGGTAPLAGISGYRVAGKTGTANRVDPSCGCYRGYVASFVGFAPADNPKVVVEVVLDNPKQGHFGGDIAAPVFAKVMSFALATEGAAPSGSRSPKLLLDLDTRT